MKKITVLKAGWLSYIVFICLSIQQVEAQDSLTLKLAYIAVKEDRPAILIGQQLPDFGFSKLIKYPSGTIRVADLKGKYLVLDFWHQYCSTCIAAFPSLHILQQRFKDSLLILPVTFQSEQSVLAFYDKRKKAGKEVLLPSIVEDTLLRKYFPHNGDPYDIWVGKEGIVKAITDNRALTEENLQKFIQQGAINLPVQHLQPDFDPVKPFLVNNNGGPPTAFLYRSQLAGYIDSIRWTPLIEQSSTSQTRLFIANATLLDIYKQLFSRIEKDITWTADPFNKKVLLEVDEPAGFRDWTSIRNSDYTEFQDFQQHNLYCYELILPAAFSLEKAYAIMLENLNRYFHVNVSIQVRKIPCLALVTQNTPVIQSAKAKPAPSHQPTWEDDHYILRNRPIEDLAEFLNLQLARLPQIINETHQSYNVDIDLLIHAEDDLETIQQQLKKIGLALVPKEKELYRIVIKDSFDSAKK